MVGLFAGAILAVGFSMFILAIGAEERSTLLVLCGLMGTLFSVAVVAFLLIIS